MLPRVLIVPDKFKGSLDATRVAHAIEEGLRRVWPEAVCTKLPMTDGGEGFVELLARKKGGVVRRYGTMTFFQAERMPGFDFFAAWSDLEEQMRQHDLVVHRGGVFG